MEYVIENEKLFRINENGNKEQLLFVVDNGRFTAIVVEIRPIKDSWLNECKEFGIINYNENQPTPFWNNENERIETLKKVQKKLDELKEL